jgi:hypothetical protein
MELELELKDGHIFLETDNDAVLDFISTLEDEVRGYIYQGLDQYPENDTNINFKIQAKKGCVYGFIHKFCKKDDSGLIYALSKDYRELAEFANEKFEGEVGSEIAKQIIISNEDI